MRDKESLKHKLGQGLAFPGEYLLFLPAVLDCISQMPSKAQSSQQFCRWTDTNLRLLSERRQLPFCKYRNEQVKMQYPAGSSSTFPDWGSRERMMFSESRGKDVFTGDTSNCWEMTLEQGTNTEENISDHSFLHLLVFYCFLPSAKPRNETKRGAERVCLW